MNKEITKDKVYICSEKQFHSMCPSNRDNVVFVDSDENCLNVAMRVIKKIIPPDITIVVNEFVNMKDVRFLDIINFCKEQDLQVHLYTDKETTKRISKEIKAHCKIDYNLG